jgi:hypothetical protein
MTNRNIRVSIKGSREEAKKALAERKILGTFVTNSTTSTVWNIDVEYQSQLVAWFCEKNVCIEGVGFPPGTLLFYR